MSTESKGRDLFIVDNSVSGWTGLRYLDEWTGIAKAFDIATGYFETGCGPEWSKDLSTTLYPRQRDLPASSERHIWRKHK